MHIIGQIFLNLYNKLVSIATRYISSQQVSNPAIAAQPPRRTPSLFFAILTISGMFGGITFGPPLASLAGGMDAAAMGIMVSIVGAIGGLFLARLYKERYRRAYNGWHWMALAFVAYLASGLISLLLILTIMALIGLVFWYIIILFAPFFFWLIIFIITLWRRS